MQDKNCHFKAPSLNFSFSNASVVKVKSHLQIYSEEELPWSPSTSIFDGPVSQMENKQPHQQLALTEPIYSGQSSVLSMGAAESIQPEASNPSWRHLHARVERLTFSCWKLTPLFNEVAAAEKSAWSAGLRK